MSQSLCNLGQNVPGRQGGGRGKGGGKEEKKKYHPLCHLEYPHNVHLSLVYILPILHKWQMQRKEGKKRKKGKHAQHPLDSPFIKYCE